jgi:hypothetical protein
LDFGFWIALRAAALEDFGFIPGIVTAAVSAAQSFGWIEVKHCFIDIVAGNRVAAMLHPCSRQK